MNKQSLVALLGMMLSVAACSSDHKSASGATQSAGEPLYAVFTSVFDPDGRENYVNLVSNLSGQEIDLSQGIEKSGLSRFYAPDVGGFFALGDGDALTIERWDAGADGAMTKTNTLSLQGVGVTQLQYTAFFISETKAYYFDYTQSQLVVWNPKAMTITKTVPLPQTTNGDLPTYFNLIHAVIRPGKLLITMGWDDVNHEVSAETTGLLVMNTDSDTVAHFESTDRCAAADNLIISANGDAYYATDQYHLEWNTAVRGKTRPGCVLRIKADEERFDPDYLVNLSDATDGKVAWGIAPAGDEGKVFISVLDESVVAWTPDVTSDALSGAAWQLWTLDLASGKASLAPNTTYGAPADDYIETDGRTFVVQPSADYSTSQLFEVGSGSLTLRATANGYINTVTRVR